MSSPVHVAIVQGPEQGRSLTIPAEGARVGRASKNDIVLEDPSLSRHHCRFLFREGGALWVMDLGSANQTLVNGQAVQEVQLRIGDNIVVGDTVLRVVCDGLTGPMPAVQAPPPSLPGSAPTVAEHVPAPSPSPVPAAAAEAAGPSPAAIDLGLGAEKTVSTSKMARGPLILAACLVTALALAVWVPRFMRAPSSHGGPPPPPPPKPALELDYEKVVASAENIFRYSLHVGRDGVVLIEIDDLKNKRHVRDRKKVLEDVLLPIGRGIEEAGFFSVAEQYVGVRSDNVLESWDISMTWGPRTHRSKVLNRALPDILKDVTEKIEIFGQNELGLMAMQFPTEKLIEMARAAFTEGKKLYDERENLHENLSKAIRNFRRVEIDLETVTPKPDFYGEALAGLSDARRELQTKYEDRKFRAERSIRLEEWAEAKRELQVICDLIPDRSDDRHQQARKKLVEIETRLAVEKKTK